jgi:hypothetical protein
VGQNSGSQQEVLIQLRSHMGSESKPLLPPYAKSGERITYVHVIVSGDSCGCEKTLGFF